MEEIGVVINAVVVLIGTFGGIMVNGKLTNHRISELEKKVEHHNNVIHRTFILEEKVSNLEKGVVK